MMGVENNPKVYYWAQLLGAISFITPVLTLFYLHRGLTLQDVLILFIIDVVFSFIFEIPTGAFADKYGHKASLIISQILLIFSMAIWIFAFDNFLFYIAAAIAGISTTFHSGTKDALIYESLKEVKKENTFGKVWSKIQAAAMIPAIFSVIIGAYIAKDLLEYQFIAIIIGGLIFAFIKLLLLFKLSTPKSHYDYISHSPLHHLKNGITFLKNTPSLLLLLIGAMLIIIPYWAFLEYVQPYLTNAGVAVSWLGIIYAAGKLVSVLILHNVKYFESLMNPRTALRLTGIVIFILYLLAASFPNYAFVGILVFIGFSITNSIRSGFWYQVKNDYVPSKSRATILSLLSGMDSLFDIVIIGTLAYVVNYGIPSVFYASAGFVLSGLLFPIKLHHEIKKKKQRAP
jgi:MFS family permease